MKGCTIEAMKNAIHALMRDRFQLLLKGCTIEANAVLIRKCETDVSVVVERMYD